MKDEYEFLLQLSVIKKELDVIMSKVFKLSSDIKEITDKCNIKQHAISNSLTFNGRFTI